MIKRSSHLIAIVSIAVHSGCSDAVEEAEPTLSEWRVVEDLRIGSLDGDDALTLVPDIVLGVDGQIIVPQPRELLIRVFDSDGSVVTQFGGEGDGPGELQEMTRVGRLGPDTVFVSMAFARSTHLFRDNGEFLGVMTFREVPYQPPYYGGAPYGFLNDGRGVLYPVSSVEATELPVLLLSPDGQVVTDTVASINADEPVQYSIQSGIGERPVDPLISHLPRFHIAADADLNAVVDWDWLDGRSPEVYRLTLFSGSGDRQSTTDVPFEPTPLGAEIAELLLASLGNFHFRVGGFSSEEEAVRALRAAIPIPESYPPVSSVRVTSSGLTYVGLFTSPLGDARRWDVFSSEGEPIGYLTLPPSAEVLEADEDHIYVVEPNEFNLPFVVRYRISR